MPWEKVYTSSSGCIGERNWRDIIAILCENPNSNIFQSSHHRHERPVRRTGRPAKRAGTHRGTIVARKDDVLPMVREETGFKATTRFCCCCCSLVFFFSLTSFFLSLIDRTRMTTTTTGIGAETFSPPGRRKGRSFCGASIREA